MTPPEDRTDDPADEHTSAADDDGDEAAATAPATGDRLATGVLAAEREAQDGIDRRRRLLVGGAVLGLLIAGAVLAAITVMQQQANTAAQEAADRAEARAAFATDVVRRAEDYQSPATTIRARGEQLRLTLEQFLAATELTDDDLADRTDAFAQGLAEQATQLEELTARDVPAPSDLIDPDRALEVLRELETLRAEAGALGEEVPTAVEDASAWADVVRDVNAAVDEHVEQVESEPATSDPDTLIGLWEAERPGLRRLSTAAGEAATVEGLEDWAAAHEAYAADLLAWIDEAVALLEDGEFDTYNERFDELFATDDPFGFNEAVADAVPSALASPALLQLGTLQERASIVLEAVDRTEVTVAEQLDGDGSG